MSASVSLFQVDAQSHDGLTALGFAAAAGHLDIVTMLSQHRAKVAADPESEINLTTHRPKGLVD